MGEHDGRAYGARVGLAGLRPVEQALDAAGGSLELKVHR